MSDYPESSALKLDEQAISTDDDLPAFLARPDGAPVYYGFPILQNSEKDGFIFGTITDPCSDTPQRCGDAYLIAPNGARAGILWDVGVGSPHMSGAPDDDRWGICQLFFAHPIQSEAELVQNFHALLPEIKALYDAVCQKHPKWKE